MGLLSRIKSPLNRANWAMALLGAFVRLIAVLSVSEAFAQGPNDWTDSRYYVECGQDCLYNKANEKVTMQAMYLVKKMQNLGQTLAGGKDDDFSHVISALKLYCPEVSDTSKSGTDAEKCYARYIQTQIPILRAMKATLVQNEDMGTRLNSNVAAVGGTPLKSSEFADMTPGNRRPQTSEFEKENELLLSSKKVGDRLAYLSKESYAEWANQMQSLAPKESEFVKTEKVLVPDSTVPGGKRSVNRIVRDANGNPVIDNQAYKLAKTEYQQRINGTGQGIELNLNKVAKGYEKKFVMEVDPNVRAQLNALKPGTKSFGTTKIDDVSYSESRNEILGEKLKNAAKGVYTQSFAGAPKATDRKTASTSPNDIAKTSSSTIDQLHKEAEKVGYDQVTQPVADATQAIATASRTNETLHLDSASLESAIQNFQDEVNILK